MKKSEEIRTRGLNLALHIGLKEFELWKEKQNVYPQMVEIEKEFVAAQKEEEAAVDSDKAQTSGT